jgi:hypothetical protein
MSKLRLNQIDFENFDELDELYENSIEMITNKKRKNGKFKENSDEEGLPKSYGETSKRGDGDSFISKRRKSRS